MIVFLTTLLTLLYNYLILLLIIIACSETFDVHLATVQSVLGQFHFIILTEFYHAVHVLINASEIFQ